MTDTIKTMRELSAEEVNTVSGGCCSLCDQTVCYSSDCPALNMSFGGGGGGMPGLLQS